MAVYCTYHWEKCEQRRNGNDAEYFCPKCNRIVSGKDYYKTGANVFDYSLPNGKKIVREIESAKQAKRIPTKLIFIAATLVLVVAVIMITILGIGDGSKEDKKLGGSFVDWIGWRYEFNITETGHGDYGGEYKEFNQYGELQKTASWYVEDNTVYINGEKEYEYDGKYVYSLSVADWITIENGDILSGYDSNWEEGRVGGMWFTEENDCKRRCYFIEHVDITVAGTPMSYDDIVEGTYTVEDGIIRIYDQFDYLDRFYAIVDGEVRYWVLMPV